MMKADYDLHLLKAEKRDMLLCTVVFIKLSNNHFGP